MLIKLIDVENMLNIWFLLLLYKVIFWYFLVVLKFRINKFILINKEMIEVIIVKNLGWIKWDGLFIIVIKFFMLLYLRIFVRVVINRFKNK